MILRTLILVLVASATFTTSSFAGSERGSRLLSEIGGVAGAAGAAGIGIPGLPGIIDFADFYALMPPDNPDAFAVVAAGSAVEFPQDGPTSGIITRLSSSTFLLPIVGTYLVDFQASVTEAGQLMLRLNGGLVANSVVGRATGTSQIVGMSLVTTTSPNSVIEVINPPGNSPALTITEFAGSVANPVSAHLIIIRLR